MKVAIRFLSRRRSDFGFADPVTQLGVSNPLRSFGFYQFHRIIRNWLKYMLKEAPM